MTNKIDFGYGFSLDVDGNSPVSGYMVSIQGCETIVPLNELTGEVLANITLNYVAKIREEQKVYSGKLYFGAWVEGSDVYFDISENVANIKDAFKLGLERNQLAIFDVAKSAVVYL